MREIHRNRKFLAVLFLLCVTALAQVSALSTQNQSHVSGDHCCLLCHVGPLPFVQTSVLVALAPVFHVVWMAPAAHPETTSDVRVVPSPSRAPPAV
jgi:hypothetical protein